MNLIIICPSIDIESYCSETSLSRKTFRHTVDAVSVSRCWSISSILVSFFSWRSLIPCTVPKVWLHSRKIKLSDQKCIDRYVSLCMYYVLNKLQRTRKYTNKFSYHLGNLVKWIFNSPYKLYETLEFSNTFRQLPIIFLA